MNWRFIGEIIIIVVSNASAYMCGRLSRDDDDETPDAYWDPDCVCCQAGCDEADDNNQCIVCGH